MVAKRFLPSFFFVLFGAFVVKHWVASMGCPSFSGGKCAPAGIVALMDD